LHGSSGEGETLEQHVRKVHRVYLAALMRLEALEGEEGSTDHEAARLDHELQSRLLRALLSQLGYVPMGLTRRGEIQREIVAADAAAMTGQMELWLGRSARATTRAGTSIRSA
jgi:hypothetical protein